MFNESDTFHIFILNMQKIIFLKILKKFGMC